MSISDTGKEMRAIADFFADVAWKDQMIRDLCEALKFYADEKNYQQRGWQGDTDPSPVDSDNGKIARRVLEKNG